MIPAISQEQLDVVFDKLIEKIKKNKLEEQGLQNVLTLNLFFLEEKVTIVDTSCYSPLRVLRTGDVVSWLDAPVSIAMFNPFTVTKISGEFVNLGYIHHPVHYSKLSPVSPKDSFYSKNDRNLYNN